MGTEEGIARRKEKDKLRKRAAYRENPDAFIAGAKAYYAENRDKVLAYKKAYGETPEQKAAKQAYNRKYREANKEKAAARSKAHYEANREHYRFKNLAAKYGITREQFDGLIAKQGGCCAICTKQFGATRKDWPHVDHCHDSSRIRGLLCIHCNFLIGQAKDNPENLRAAIRYLQADKSAMLISS